MDLFAIIQKLGSFVVLLGTLVFVHELGHFVVARWAGVRVLSFSIGFGPVVHAWHRGGTEYAVRAFPLGGYVKMLGDDPTGQEGLENERGLPPPPDSFGAKPVWRRAAIVAAGPIANFLLPVVILFGGSMMMDAEVISSRLGTVLPGGPAGKAGLRSGDLITAVDGAPIHSFNDLRREISARPGRRTIVAFERGGEARTLTLTPDAKRDVRLPEIGIVDTVGRIQVLPDGQSAIIAVDPGSAAWNAGLRSGWKVTAVGGKPSPRFYELEAALGAVKGATVKLEAIPLHRAEPAERKALTKARKALHAGDKRVVELDLSAGRDAAALGIRAAQTVIGVVEKGSPADIEAGLRPGDEILAIDGVAMTSYFKLLDTLRKPYDDARTDPASRGLEGEELLAMLRQALARPRKLQIRRGDQVRTADMRLHVNLDRNERPELTFGASRMQRYEPPEKVANVRRVAYAWERTTESMSEAIKVTVLTVAGLFRGHVPMKEVGGPIFMAQLAAEATDRGVGFFLHLMVWLSINLGIINLLPIPLVDGGQLLFLGVEAIKRKPVSLRTRMIASYVGMSFIGLLFVVVMKNDVQRLIASFGQ